MDWEGCLCPLCALGWVGLFGKRFVRGVWCACMYCVCTTERQTGLGWDLGVGAARGGVCCDVAGLGPRVWVRELLSRGLELMEFGYRENRKCWV